LQKLVSYLLFSLTLICSTFGQNLRFSELSNSDGLSQSVVNCIIQDNYGYMWFGTQDGLNKYDGYTITVIKNNPHDSFSLSGNNIISLCEDNELIWIGTNESGLNSYNRFTNKFTSYKYEEGNQNSLINNKVKSITKDEQGIIWIGTDAGLCSFNKSTQQFKRYTSESGLTNTRVWSVFQSNQDKDVLIVGTFGGGVHLFNKKTETFNRLIDTNSNGSLKVPKSDKVRTVVEDKEGNIWIGTNNVGLVKYDIQNQLFEYFINGKEDKNLSNPRIRNITEMNDGNLWIGTFNGLNIYHPKTKTFSKYYYLEQDDYSLSNNNIRYIYPNTDGSIVWLGTDGGGVNVYKKLANRFENYYKEENKSNTLSENTVMAITEVNDSSLWIGTLGGGIDVLNRKTNTYVNYPFRKNKLHHRILALHQDKEGLVWVASWGGGVNYYHPETEEFSKPFEEGVNINNTSISNNTIVDIEEDNNNNIWFASLNGLNKYDKTAQEFTNYFTSDGLINNSINSLYFDSDVNSLWVGTTGGLCQLDMTSNKFKNIDLKKENLAINCIVKVEEDKYWIGTSMGLAEFEPSKDHVKWYYQVDGLPNEYIYGIVVDKDKNLWISTNNGISKFDYKKNENKGVVEFKNYYEIDGLQSNEFNQGAYYISQQNEVFFGGINGFNSFFPDKIIDNQHQPPLYFTSFKVFEREVVLDSSIAQKKHLELSYKDRFFSFEFVGLDYNLPEKNLYSWRLEGLDEDWTPPTKRRYISYNNLPGGSYTLRIKAANNDGIWNNEGISIQIKIIPPFWKTTWFYIICILLGAVIVYFYIKIREQKLRAEKQVLEQKVAERTHELQEKNEDILSSIQYAKRIQEAILPPVEEITKHFTESFIFYQPKDIVSGDFYWFGVKNNKYILVAADCTGHGVPGAFMSMIGHNLLHQIIIKDEILDPAEILTKLDKGVIKALKQNEIDTKDGMDLSLIVYDKKANTIEYSGAYRPLYLYQNKELTKVNADKFPIGGGNQIVMNKEFTNHKIDINKGDTIYLFSDGYPDQFGGEKGKKMMTKRFQHILQNALEMEMNDQHEYVKKEFMNWKGNLEQIDDVLVIGIKF